MADAVVFDRRVYIVEDDPALRRLIRRILTDAGVLTEEFDSAEAFLDNFMARPAGCILLDIRLPGIDGLELLARIREFPSGNSVVMLSGHGDIPTAVSAVKAGATDFLQKPFRKEDLLRAVASAFSSVNTGAASAAEAATLTVKEKEVFAAFSDGAATKVAAARLGLSPRTVEMHRSSIIRKLGAKNLTEALLRARDGRTSD